MSRIRCALIVVLLVLGTACRPEHTVLPEASERERKALTAFRGWVENRTSTRKEQKSEVTTAPRGPHGSRPS